MEKRNIANSIFSHLLNIIQGAMIGAFSMIPFTQVNNLKEILKQKDFEISGERKLADYPKSILSYLAHNFTYLLGFALGMVLFFIVSWETVITSSTSSFTSYYTYAYEYYHTAMFMGILCLIPGSLIYEIYKLTKTEKKKDPISISTAITSFILAVGIALLLFFFLPKIIKIKDMSAGIMVFFFIIGIIATFLTSWLGTSVGTLLFFTTFYLNFSDFMNEFLRTRENLGFVILFLLGCLIGYALSTLMNLVHYPLQREKIVARIGFYVAGIICTLVQLTPPYLNEVYSTLSQNLTIVSTMLGALLVSVGLTIHGYPFFNKQEEKEKKNNETR